MLARDLPKLFNGDPSGYWKLVRDGKELPVVGQQILYVYDIRGTASELRHKMFVNIAAGNPYRVTDEAPSRLPHGVQALHAELFRLPTEGFKPETHIGVVSELGFDEVLQEHWIAIKSGNSFWSRYHAPEHIIHWAPIPAPVNTYVPREGDLADVYYTDRLYELDEHALRPPVDED
jgi:hypothetical protein